jgi:hypothetical protein
MIFEGYNRINRQKKRKGVKKTLDSKVGLQESIITKNEGLDLPIKQEPLLLQYYGAEKKDKEKQEHNYETERVPKPIEELSESDEDSKYGFSIFGAEETEIGEDPREIIENFYPPENYHAIQTLEDAGPCRYMDREGVMRRMGMHRINLNEY